MFRMNRIRFKLFFPEIVFNVVGFCFWHQSKEYNLKGCVWNAINAFIHYFSLKKNDFSLRRNDFSLKKNISIFLKKNQTFFFLQKNDFPLKKNHLSWKKNDFS